MLSRLNYILLLFLFTQISLLAQDTANEYKMPPPIIIDRNSGGQSITDKVVYFHDVSETMTVQDFIKQDSLWIKPDSHVSSLALNPEGRYWVLFQLENTDSLTLWMEILLGSQQLDKTKLYTYHKGQLDSSHLSGALIPLHQRPTLNSIVGFFEPLPPKSIVTYYMSIECRQLPVQTHILLYNSSNSKTLNVRKKEYNSIGIYVGVGLTFCLLAILLFLFFPIQLHFWYALYVFSGTLYTIAATGLGSEHIWTNYLKFNRFSAEIMGAILVSVFLMMARTALNMAAINRWVNRLILSTVAFAVFFIIATLLIDSIAQNLYIGIAFVTAISVLITFFMVFITALWQYSIKKDKKSGWFILLFTSIMLGVCTVLVSEIGWIEKSGFILGQLPFLLLLIEVLLSSLYIIKNLYDTLITKEQEIVQAQTLHLSEMSRISSDLHDEMGSKLSSISILSQVALNDLPTEFDKKRFDTIGSRAREVMDTMSDIVWSANPNNDTMPQIIERMKTFAAEILEIQNIKIHFLIDHSVHDIVLKTIERKDTYLIFKEAVNNVAKYAEATAVTIQLRYENPVFLMQIEDNGKGFDPSVPKAGNGLKNMHTRAKNIGGQLTIKSDKNQGTTIILNLPIT